jgi:FKBP-type peptidyl-prolyl cis-trans isomerase
MRKLMIIALAAALGAAPLCACAAQEEAAAAGDAGKNLAAAKAWMANNAKQPGVVTLPSGVQYKIVRSGAAAGAHPRPQDWVKIHYEGKLANGEVFDSSYERGVPASFVLGDLIPAWVEGLQRMRPGDEWILYVPPEQGYGEEGAPPKIPSNSALVFRIELFDILPGYAVN